MGKPGKLKSGTRNKLKKWSKGNSCTSNPKERTYREKARSRFFHMQPTSKSNKGLTLEALKIHDEMEVGYKPVSHVDDNTSDDGNTFGTFLSGLSDCTNVTFTKIQRYWLNNSAKHKEVCAVLAAITEVIREQGGKESNTAYFAALITALSSVEQVESAAAVAYLLAMACKNVPVPVLRAKFGEVSQLLSNMLAQTSKSDESSSTALTRSLLSCLAVLLRQQDISVWDNSSTTNVFNMILSFVVHAKPKIRKAGQNAVCSVLCGSGFILNATGNPPIHPAASLTAKFCVSHLEKFGGMTVKSSVCHVLLLLGRILHCFSQSSLKHACEAILRTMTLSDPVVKSVCLQSLHGMFLNKLQHTSLSPDLNAQIITALYDYYPNAADAQGCPAWLATMEKAILNLSLNYQNSSYENNAKTLALVHISKLSNTCFKFLISPSPVVVKAAASTVNTLMKECASKFWSDKDLDGSNEEQTKFVSTIFQLLEGGLKYKYHAVWDLVFEICQITFESIVKPSHVNIVKSSLTNLADLRNTPLFQYKSELDRAVGAAIKSLGPKLVLEAVPLQIDGNEIDLDFPRSWLLPVMTSSITHSELSFFAGYFLPLAAKLRKKIEEMKSAGYHIEATTYSTLQCQCWNLLPVFCKGATDIAAAFPSIARVLGRALGEQSDLRLTVMQALRNVIISSKKSDKDQAVVARFAKNFLPILFNLYTSDNTENISRLSDPGKRKTVEQLGALETIKFYLSISDQQLVLSYFQKSQARVFGGENESDYTRLALFDLMISMVTYVTLEVMENVYDAVNPMLASRNSRMQKKAYRLLEELCASNMQPCQSFVQSHLSELEKLLLDGLSSAAMSSKGPRIKCMEQLFVQLHCNPDTHSESIEFLKAILPEVILCTKGSQRSRISAFNLLVTSAHAYVAPANSDEKSGDEIDKTKSEEYFQLVMAGLAGSPTMIQSTILALSRLVYEFKNKLTSSLLDMIITNITLLLGSNTQEVCRAAIGFVMVLLSILDRPTLAQYVKGILDAFLNWSPTTRRQFRFKIKIVFQRFVQKFGFETVNSLTPESYKGQLQHVQKVQERAKRKAAERKNNAESDDDEEETVKKNKKETIDEILADLSDSDDERQSGKPKIKKSKSKKSAWLLDKQDEPMDFMDPSISQQVLGADPKASSKRKTDPNFKTAADGRLIIGDDELSDSDGETKKILSGLGIARNAFQNSAKKPGEKRKMKDDDSDDEDFFPAKKRAYQPGGKGIHRDVKAEESGVTYKSKKGGGDTKRKGAHEPYAYLPFNKSVLNKRKQKKMTGQFNGLVKAAKKGAVAGRKNKFMKDNKKHKKKK